MLMSSEEEQDRCSVALMPALTIVSRKPGDDRLRTPIKSSIGAGTPEAEAAGPRGRADPSLTWPTGLATTVQHLHTFTFQSCDPWWNSCTVKLWVLLSASAAMRVSFRSFGPAPEDWSICLARLRSKEIFDECCPLGPACGPSRVLQACGRVRHDLRIGRLRGF